jgi:hypothetical protein
MKWNACPCRIRIQLVQTILQLTKNQTIIVTSKSKLKTLKPKSTLVTEVLRSSNLTMPLLYRSKIVFILFN